MTKSKKSFSQRRKKETYYKQAQKTEVRARSFFKLKQLDEKFNLVHNATTILDLGAAPGGWLQYLDKKIDKGTIIGIDLLEIKAQQEFSNNVQIIEDDFNNLDEYIEQEIDLMLSDMAPEFSGDSKVDRGRTHQLNLKTLELAQTYLKPKGNLAFKTFEGEDLKVIREEAKKIFKQVKDFKPNSSQKKSAEFFIVCLEKN